MSLTTTAIDTHKGVTVRLSVNEQQLVISNGSDDPTPPITVDLDFIYGIEERGDMQQLRLHIVEQQEDESSDGQTASIANFRNAGKTRWTRRTLTFDKPSTGDFAARLRQRVLPNVRDQRVVAIVNPGAGAGRAMEQWRDTVQPMLVAAGFDVDAMRVTETKAGGQTRLQAEQLGVKMLTEQMQGEATPPRRTVFLILGGDGTVHEVVNGLSDAYDRRVDWPMLPTFQLGIIPSGSGNALSLSLQLQSVEHAVLRIIKQRSQPLRLVDVALPGQKQQDRKLRILVVMSWGFHAQLVSKARYLKPFVDNRRFSWVAMWLLYFLRHYAGELTIHHAQRYNRETKAFDAPEAGPIVIDDEHFTYFAVTKQAALERGFTITPFASPATEDMDVIMMRNATKEQLSSTTVMAIKGGKHVDEADGVEYYKAAELELKVRDATDICLDGEICSVPANSTIRLKVVGPSQGEPNFQTFV